jgi:hypothetical protein
MKTEILDLDSRFGEQFAGKYMFREITWAKRNRIIQKHTKYNNVTGDVISSDFVAIQADTIMAALHGQPPSHPLTLEKLLADDPEQGLPYDFGELIAGVANRVCGLDKAETRFLSSASEEENPIVLSQTSGSLKSSGGPQTKSPSSQPEQSTSTSPSSTS